MVRVGEGTCEPAERPHFVQAGLGELAQIIGDSADMSEEAVHIDGRAILTRAAGLRLHAAKDVGEQLQLVSWVEALTYALQKPGCEVRSCDVGELNGAVGVDVEKEGVE